MMAIGIVAHQTRSKHAHRLQQAVQAEFISFGPGSCEDNHQIVQTHLSNLKSAWSIVLEDDAEPIEDFRQQAQRALEVAPSPIVSFYLGKKRPQHWQPRIAKALQRAQAKDCNWITATHMLHAVGYAIQTQLLPSLLDYHSCLPADQHIGAWARQHGHTIAYTVPSLIDHADMPTIVNHKDGEPRRAGRKAWTCGTRDNWTTTTVNLNGP